VGLTLAAVVSGADHPIVWTAFSPLNFNQVGWDDTDLSVFASTTQLTDGAVIEVASTDTASLGKLYAYQGPNFTNQPGSPGVVGLKNDFAGLPSLTLGLIQGSNDEDAFPGGPAHAAVVMQTLTATVQPQPRLWVFAGPYERSQVLSRYPERALEVDLSSNPSPTVHWDDTEGRFVGGPLG
jgi:hypothetical protein